MFACTKPVSSSPFTFRVEHDLEQKGGQLQFISFVFKVDFWEHNYIYKKKLCTIKSQLKAPQGFNSSSKDQILKNNGEYTDGNDNDDNDKNESNGGALYQ